MALVLRSPIVLADSPLTSTPFYTAYMDIPQVKAATEAEALNKESIAFLSGSHPIDQKMALINALSWGKMEYVNAYRDYLAGKHKLPLAFFDSVLVYRGETPETYPGTELLSQDELICLAYLQAMGNYFEPLKAHYLAWQAFNRGPTRTHAIIYGLIIAQYNLDRDWCYVYNVMVQVRDEPLITVNDMRQEALDIIFDYINLYSSECNTEEPVMEEDHTFDLIQAPPQYESWGERQLISNKKEYVDLSVVEILDPEYLEEIDGTRVRVIIMNKGTVNSYPTLAQLKDIDLSAKTAKAEGLKGDQLRIASELEYIATDPNADDEYFESYCVIPSVGPGKKYVLDFLIYGHWIYDPNCEIKVILDLENVIEETNEKNNSLIFVAGG